MYIRTHIHELFPYIYRHHAITCTYARVENVCLDANKIYISPPPVLLCKLYKHIHTHREVYISNIEK